MDSMVGNAYHYGRNWIATKVGTIVKLYKIDIKIG